MVEVSVRAAATPAVVDLVLDELALLWERRADVAVDDRRRFETGLVEVLGNVVEHAHRPDGGDGPTDGRLSVDVAVTAEALSAVLGDHGRPAAIDLGDVAMSGPDAESGRGLALALASLDHLEHQHVHGGNRWTLRCDRA